MPRRSVPVTDTRDEAGLVWIRKTHLVELHRPFPGRSALGGLENEASAVINGDLFGIARDRVLDRLERDPELVAETGGALQAIKVEFERDELGLEQRVHGG